MPPKVSKHRDAAAGEAAPAGIPPIVRNESLLASETERKGTSKSMYGDHKARVSSNVSAITDRVRNRAFMGMLQRCAKGKTVLHVGCGIGLWAMVAARSKAKLVVGVDTSAIVETARVVASQNRLDNLQFFQGKMADVKALLPVQSFDIVVCDWIGQFLTNDALFAEIAYCRQHLLAPGGFICPDTASLHVAAITDYRYYQDTVHFWDNVYGFTMKPMQPLVTTEPTSGHIPRNFLATNTCLIHTVSLATPTDVPAAAAAAGEDAAVSASPAPSAAFSGPFTLHVSRKATLHFLTFYVDCRFAQGPDPGARFAIQHGGEGFLTEVSVFLPEPIPVFTGDCVSGTVAVKPHGGKVTEITLTVKCHNSLVQHDSVSTHRFQY